MKHVLEYIKRHSLAFNEKPLFVFLRDPRVDPRERLTFVPYLAHFIMGFPDLCALMTETPARDRFQELINAHVMEENDHWKWFLADLASLDLDPVLHFTDALRFIWSESTVKTRALSYQMCILSARLSSIQKLVMLLAVEGTARTSFESVVSAAREVEAQSGRKLVFFGQHHLDTEQRHELMDETIQESLAQMVVTDETRAEFYSIVDNVYHHFGAFVAEAFELANRRIGVGEFTTLERVDGASDF